MPTSADPAPAIDKVVPTTGLLIDLDMPPAVAVTVIVRLMASAPGDKLMVVIAPFASVLGAGLVPVNVPEVAVKVTTWLGMAALTASLTVTTKFTLEPGAEASELAEAWISMEAGLVAPIGEPPSAVTTTGNTLPAASTNCNAAVPAFKAVTVSVDPLILPVITRASVLATEYGEAPPLTP